MMNAQVTTFEQLQEMAKGTIIELPGFTGNQPFVVRVKRPSLFNLMANGKIPNSLKVRANELFQGGGSSLDVEEEDLLKDLHDIFEIFAKDAMLEPTYDQVIEAGLELTDEQLMALFDFAQKGVKGLESFRQE